MSNLINQEVLEKMKIQDKGFWRMLFINTEEFEVEGITDDTWEFNWNNTKFIGIKW